MKFRFSDDFVIETDQEPWCREGLRITMLGGPGSGKSWNNSLVAEQFLSQGGTVVVFQPRDEYFTLKEKFDVLSVGGVHAKDMEFALTSPSIYTKGPLTIYGIHREMRARRRLRHTRYASVNKRLRSLAEAGYLKKIGIKKTKADFKASIYELTARAYLAILLNSINLDELVT